MRVPIAEVAEARIIAAHPLDDLRPGTFGQFVVDGRRARGLDLHRLSDPRTPADFYSDQHTADLDWKARMCSRDDRSGRIFRKPRAPAAALHSRPTRSNGGASSGR